MSLRKEMKTSGKLVGSSPIATADPSGWEPWCNLPVLAGGQGDWTSELRGREIEESLCMTRRDHTGFVQDFAFVPSETGAFFAEF